MKSAFDKLYDHAEDSGMDKRQLFWEAAEASADDPYLNRQVHLAELDREGYDEKYKVIDETVRGQARPPVPLPVIMIGLP